MHDTALPGICDNGLPSTKGNRIMHNKTYPEMLAALLEK